MEAATSSASTPTETADSGVTSQDTTSCSWTTDNDHNWADFFLSHYPLRKLLQLQSHAEGATDNNERNLELLLYHPNVQIRSRHRSAIGTWTWKPRQIALIRSRTSSSINASRRGRRGGECSCSKCLAPIILLYDNNSRSSSHNNDDDSSSNNSFLPTGAARLLRESSGRRRLSVSSTLVSNHPRHVEIVATLVDCIFGGSDLSSDVFAGGSIDLLKKKTTTTTTGEIASTSTEENNRVVRYAWRIKFPDEETAMLWQDVLADALLFSLPAEVLGDNEPEPVVGMLNDDGLQARQLTQTHANRSSNGHGQTDDISFAKTDTTDTTETTTAARNPFANYCVGVFTFLLSIKAFEGWGLNLLYHLIDGVLEIDGVLQLSIKENLGELNQDVVVNEEEIPKEPKYTASGVLNWVTDQPIIDQVGSNWTSSSPYGTSASDHFNRIATEALLEPRPTPYRNILRFLSEYSTMATSIEFWLAALASVVLLVSSSSLFYQMLPAMSFASAGVLQRVARHGLLAIALISSSALLCHDTYVNHLSAPLRHGLYWHGWIQCLVSFAMLARGKIATKVALGLPMSPNQMSPARTASAGVSGCAVTSSLPLALRGIHAMEEGRMRDAAITWAGALLVFFVGLYFLGRAVRHVTAFGGIPMGMYLHRASLLPVRFCYGVLSFAGDSTRTILKFAIGEVLFPLSKICYGMVRERRMLRLVVPMWQLFCTLKDYAHRCVRECLVFVETFGRLLTTLLGSTTRVIWLNLIHPIVTRFLTILRYLWRKFALPCLRLSLRAAWICNDSAIRLGSLSKSTLLSIYLATVQNILRPIYTSLQRVFIHVGMLLGKIFDKVATIFGPPIVTVCGLFTKRYWKLIPALSILNGSVVFVEASISTGMNTFSMVQYLLGAWALLLIGLTIANAVLTNAGGSSLTRQHIVIADSAFFRLVDLHIGYVVLRTVLSGWHALSTALRLTLHAIDIVIRRSFGYLWRSVVWLHKNTAMRMSHGVGYLFNIVWNSPFLGLIISSCSLCVMYLTHVGIIYLPDLSFPVRIHATTALGYFEMYFNLSLAFFVAMSEPLKPPLLFIAKFLGDTYGPVIGVESSSPSNAFACWAFSCIIKWTCHRIRLKIFAIPAIYIYIAGVTSADIVRAFFVSFIVWIVLSTLVDRYETDQRRLVGQALPSFLSERRRISSNDDAPQKVRSAYQQSDCSICLEGLGNVASNAPNITLPCGHEFHRACIEDWLQIQSRCPICRRAAHGFDRVLEVVF